MPWFVWMCFLTVPVLVGVAYTLAADTAADPNQMNAVVVTAGVWLFVAYHLKNHLREGHPAGWVRRWVGLAVALPLGTLFALSLRHDPGVRQLVEARLRAAHAPDAGGRAAAAPARRALTWAETRDLLARLQPLALDFAFKLFTALPPAWWFVAFGVGLWKGR
ncbi:MAG: hypothetical protein U0871_00925 [Gemmataceae bacterium]